MARFDIYKNNDGDGWLLDVQSDLLSDLNTRIAIPLLPQGKGPEAAQRLNPTFKIEGTDSVMLTQFLAAVPANELKQPVGSLYPYADEVLAALDMLFTGY